MKTRKKILRRILTVIRHLQLTYVRVCTWVVDPDHVYADPDLDPSFHFDADLDPDLNFYFDSDPDPVTHKSDANLPPSAAPFLSVDSF
jgi:hypothetical protein